MLTKVSIHSAQARGVRAWLAPWRGTTGFGNWLAKLRSAELVLTFVRMTDRSDPQSGFSLIEALIALAIIAAMTGALVETVAADAHARFAVQQRREALLIAQSALDRAKGGEAVDSGRSQGPGPDLIWHIDRAPYQEGRATAQDNAVPFAPTRLELLTVTVADPGGHSLARLATVRIVQ